jgi:hypothetical protein
VLRCLGAALIMQWNTLPQKLRRELFDNASSMGELLDIGRSVLHRSGARSVDVACNQRAPAFAGL